MIRWPTRWPRRASFVVVGGLLVVGAAAGVYLGTHSFQSEVSTHGGSAQGQPVQQARSAEFARACVDKFECVPQRLPDRLGFNLGVQSDLISVGEAIRTSS